MSNGSGVIALASFGVAPAARAATGTAGVSLISFEYREFRAKGTKEDKCGRFRRHGRDATAQITRSGISPTVPMIQLGANLQY